MRAWLLVLILPLAGCLEEPAAVPQEQDMDELPATASRGLSMPFGFVIGVDSSANGVTILPTDRPHVQVSTNESGRPLVVQAQWTCAVPLCPLQMEIRNGETTVARAEGESPLAVEVPMARSGGHEFYFWPTSPGVAVDVQGTVDVVVAATS